MEIAIVLYERCNMMALGAGGQHLTGYLRKKWDEQEAHNI